MAFADVGLPNTAGGCFLVWLFPWFFSELQREKLGKTKHSSEVTCAVGSNKDEFRLAFCFQEERLVQGLQKLMRKTRSQCPIVCLQQLKLSKDTHPCL